MIKKLPDCFPKCLHIFHCHQKYVRAFISPHSHQHLLFPSVFFFFFLSLVSPSEEGYLRGPDLHFLRLMLASIFSCAYCRFLHLLEKCPFKSFAQFSLGLFLLSNYECSSYILHMNLLSDVWFANLFSYSVVGFSSPKCPLSKKTLKFHGVQFMRFLWSLVL